MTVLEFSLGVKERQPWNDAIDYLIPTLKTGVSENEYIDFQGQLQF